MIHEKNMGKILIAHFTDKTVDSIIRCYCKKNGEKGKKKKIAIRYIM